MRKPERISIHYQAKIRDALSQIEATQETLLICIDNNNKFVGVINDGDIRRALLRGASIDDPIHDYLPDKPLFVSDQVGYSEAMAQISTRIKVLPVVNPHNVVVGYYTFKEKADFSNIKSRNITVLGMGYVGLTIAVILADVGFKVVGYDINKKLIEKLKKNIPPFYEKGLQSCLDFHVGRNLQFVDDFNHAYGGVYIITVGTPVNKQSHKADISYVLKAIASVGKLLESKDLVLLRSTIPVGFTQEEVIPELEKQSGLKVGEDFHIAFAPERTAEGVALKELRYNPQIVGGYDDKSYELAASLFNSFTPSIIHVKSLEAAEMCKLLDNTYRDHKFAFANQLTKLTERLGLDLCEIIEALNHGYSRNDIPKPSPGVGGPCLSKDPYILSSVFKQYDLDSSLILNCRKVNELGPVQVKETLEKLLKKADKKITSAKLFLIGFAFKGTPETSDLRGSTSLAFLDLLPDKQNIRGYDPVVSSNDIRGLGITPVSLEEGFENADAAIILNNHPSYQDINIVEMFSKMNRPAVFIDTWHIFDPLDIKRIGGLLYGGVGNV